MISSFDYYKQIESPEMYLCNPDQRFLCALNGENRKLTLRFNDLSELTFTVPKIEGTESSYNLIETKRLIFIDKIGWFQITTVTETIEGDKCSKSVTAKSHQTVFSDRGFVTEERVYMFYNPNDPRDEKYDSNNKSAIPSVCGQLYQQLGIRIALNKSDIEPSYDRKDWTLIYIDPILHFHSRSYSGMYEPDESFDNICRSFEANSETNGYDFMVNQVEEAFEVIFEFDFLYHTIKVKTIEDITTPTSIYLSFENVINTLDVKENAEDIVTVMTCDGNDLDIRTVNPMGTNYIVDFSYYKRLVNDDGVEYPWMSKELIKALDDWEIEFNRWRVDDSSRTGHTKGYSTLVKEVQALYEQKAQADADRQYANLKLTDMQAARDQYLDGDDKPLEGSGYVTAESVDVGSKSMLSKSRFYTTPFSDTVTITGHTKGAKATKVTDDNGGYHYEFAFDDAGRSGTPRSFIETYIDSEKIEDNANIPFYFMDEDNRSYCKLTVEAEVGVVKDADGFISGNGTVEVNGVTFTVTTINGVYTITLPNGQTITASQSNSYFVYNGTRYRILSGADEIVTLYGFFISGFERYTTYAETKGNTGWVDIWQNHIDRDLKPVSDALQQDINAIEAEMAYICEQCSIKEYIQRRSQDLYNELSVYWIEGSYSNDNFATYDTTTMAERIDLANELMDAAKKDLAKSAQPQFELTVDSINFIKILEFKQFTDELELGKVITIEREDGVYYRPALMTLEYNLDSTDTFTMTFSNASKPGDTSMTFADLIKESSSISRTVAANWSMLTDYSRNKIALTNLVLQPLDRTLRAANSNMSSQAFVIDDTGILGRKYTDDSDTGFSPKQMRILNNVLMFTDDNWATAKTALGNILYEDGDGQTKEAYGLVAEVLVGSLLLGESMRIRNEGNTIDLNSLGITIKDGSDNVVFNAGTDGDVYVRGSIFATDLVLENGVQIKYENGAQVFVTMENGYMKTSDYVYEGGIYSKSGMCIDFENQFIRAENFSVDSTGSLNARSGNIGELLIEQKNGFLASTVAHQASANVVVTIPQGEIGYNSGIGNWWLYGHLQTFTLADLGVQDPDAIMGELTITAEGASTYRDVDVYAVSAEGAELHGWVQMKTNGQPLATAQHLGVQVSFTYYTPSRASSVYSLFHSKDDTFNICSSGNSSILTITNTRIGNADIVALTTPKATIGSLVLEGATLVCDGASVDFGYASGDNYEASVDFVGSTIMVYIKGGLLPYDMRFPIIYRDAGSNSDKTTTVLVKGNTNMGKVELEIFEEVTSATFTSGYTTKSFNINTYERSIRLSGATLVSSGSWNSSYSCRVGWSLGTSDERWHTLYAINVGTSSASIKTIYGDQIYQNGTEISSSDRSLKNSIEYISEADNLSTFFDSLKPATFKYNNGTSGRRHMGLIAQDVQASLAECGISQTDNAVFCSWKVTDKDGNETETCGIRYEELIPLAIYEIQELKKKVQSLEGELKVQKGEVENEVK